MDGAHDTRKCHDVFAVRGAAAIVSPSEKAQPWTPETTGAVAPAEALPACKSLGHELWRRLTGYPRQSRAETKMTCVIRPCRQQTVATHDAPERRDGFSSPSGKSSSSRPSHTPVFAPIGSSQSIEGGSAKPPWPTGLGPFLVTAKKGRPGWGDLLQDFRIRCHRPCFGSSLASHPR